MRNPFRRNKTTLPKRNKKLFYRVADLVEKHPEKYDQSTFGSRDDYRPQNGCNTVACIAGWATVLTGKVWYPDDLTTSLRLRPAFEGKYPNGLPGAAKDDLGLTEKEADLLFDGSWQPKGDMTVPEALRKLGKGAPLKEVTSVLIVPDQAMIQRLWEAGDLVDPWEIPGYDPEDYA